MNRLGDVEMMIHQPHSKGFEIIRREEMDLQLTRSPLMSQTLHTSLEKMGSGLNLESDGEPTY